MGIDSGSELFKSNSPISDSIGETNARKRIESGNKLLIDAPTEAMQLKAQKSLGLQRKRQKLLNKLSGQ